MFVIGVVVFGEMTSVTSVARVNPVGLELPQITKVGGGWMGRVGSAFGVSKLCRAGI